MQASSLRPFRPETDRQDEAVKGLLPAFFPGPPPAGKHKYLDAFELYLCPCTGSKPATGAHELSSPEHCGYLYFGKGLTREEVPNPASTVLACDRTGNQKGFWNMLFVDGHVKGFSGEDFAAMVRKNNLTVPAEAPGTRKR